MKKLRIISLVAVLAFVFTAFGCNVFASEVTNTDSAASTENINAADDPVSPSDCISNYELIELEIDQHRFSMLVPDLEGSFTANMTNAELAEVAPGYITEDFINTQDYYGNIMTYIYSGATASEEVMVNIIYSSNNFTEFIGDYSDLDEDVIEDIRTSTTAYNDTNPEILKVNGNTFLFSEGYDSDYGYYSYVMETIVGGGRYQFHIYLTNPSPADKAVVDEIIDSIKIGGLRTTLYGAADKNLVTALLIIVIVLFIVVCFLTFFVIRFSLFSSAAGSKFNIIGFNMPPSKKEIAKLRKKQAAKANQTKESALETSSIVESIED